MTSIDWKLGEQLSIEVDGVKVQFSVTGEVNGGLNLSQSDTGQMMWRSNAELLSMWELGRLLRVRPKTDGLSQEVKKILNSSPDLRSPSERAHVAWLAPYIIAFRKLGLKRHASRAKLENLINQIATERGDTSPPGWRTLSNKIKAVNEGNGDGRWMAPRIAARGNRSLRFGSFEKKIDEILRAQVLRKNRQTLKNVRALICAARDEFNAQAGSGEQVSVPSRRTLERRIQAFSIEEKVRAWEGEQAARNKCAMVQKGPRATRPLESVEADHHLLDVILVHPETRKPLGRPLLTAMIDCYSHAIVGFYISFDTPRFWSVQLCLRMAILSKEEILKAYDLPPGSWPCFGRMLLLRLDNGGEFHSASLDDVAAQLLIDTQWCRSQTPSDKPIIERWFGRISKELIHTLPGTTFSNPKDKGDYPSEKEACLTMSEFRKIVVKWIVQDYHVEVHDSTNQAPIVRWNDGVAQYPVALPPEVEDLDVLLMESETRVLTRRGIEINGLAYGSSNVQLPALLNDSAKPRESLIKVDPSNLGWIWLANWQTHRFIRLQCDELDYANGLSLFEHKHVAARVRAKVAEYRALTLDELNKTRVESVTMVDDLKARNKLRGRKSALLSNADPDTRAHKAKTLPIDTAVKPSKNRPSRLDLDVPSAADLGITIDFL